MRAKQPRLILEFKIPSPPVPTHKTQRAHVHEATEGSSTGKTRSHSTVGKARSHGTVGEAEPHVNTKRRVSAAFPNHCMTVTAKAKGSSAPVGSPGSPAETAAVDQAMAAEEAEPKAKAKVAGPGDNSEERFVRAAAAKAAEAKARVTVHPKAAAEQREVIRQSDENAPKDPRGRPPGPRWKGSNCDTPRPGSVNNHDLELMPFYVGPQSPAMIVDVFTWGYEHDDIIRTIRETWTDDALFHLHDDLLPAPVTTSQSKPASC